MKYIERDLEKEILKYLNSKEILAVVGARQCGKTTLVQNILEKLQKKGKKMSKISFDNVKDLNLFEKDTDSFVDLYIKNKDILFIDEVQYSKDSGKKLKYIYDNFDVKIFISGSSAADISIQSLKYLVGRIFTFVLYPFSFNEFLKAKDSKLQGIYQSGNYKKEIVNKLNNYLNEFILYGGYPRVVLAEKIEEKEKILENIYSTYLLKEIKEILDLSGDDELIKLLKALSLQIGNIINYNELSAVSGFAYGDLKKYLNILAKTYICSQIKPYYTNKRTELVKTPKIYFFDTGFRNGCIDNFNKERTDRGNLYENFIFSELVKQNITPKYWRTKSQAEVDFVIEKNSILVPIEIKSLLKNTKMTKSFSSFLKKYKSKKGYVLSLDFEGRRKMDSSRIDFWPFVRFIKKLKI